MNEESSIKHINPFGMNNEMNMPNAIMKIKRPQHFLFGMSPAPSPQLLLFIICPQNQNGHHFGKKRCPICMFFKYVF